LLPEVPRRDRAAAPAVRRQRALVLLERHDAGLDPSPIAASIRPDADRCRHYVVRPYIVINPGEKM